MYVNEHSIKLSNSTYNIQLALNYQVPIITLVDKMP